MNARPVKPVLLLGEVLLLALLARPLPVLAGSIVRWGDDGGGAVSPTPSGNDFIAVAAGDSFTMALREDGALACWGGNWWITSATPSGAFIAIAAGFSHAHVIRADGTILSWGSDYGAEPGQPGAVSGTPTGSGFVQVAAGDENCLALRADGSLVAWGPDWWGLVSDTPAGNDFVAVACGNEVNAALRSDGTIVTWGYGPYTFPGDDYVSLSGGRLGGSFVALRDDGSIVQRDRNGWFDIPDPPSGQGYKAVNCNEGYAIAINGAGEIEVWADPRLSAYGALMDHPTGTGFASVSAGWSHAVALTVPEPATAGLLTLGAAGFLVRVARQRRIEGSPLRGLARGQFAAIGRKTVSVSARALRGRDGVFAVAV